MNKIQKAKNFYPIVKNGDTYKQTVKEKILRSKEKTEAILLLQQGFAWKYVAKETKLSIGRVKYWASLINVKPTDYRNGKTETAKRIMRETRYFTLEYLQKELNRLKK